MTSPESSAYVHEEPGEEHVPAISASESELSPHTVAMVMADIILDETDEFEADLPENIAMAAQIFESELATEGEALEFDLLAAQREILDIPLPVKLKEMSRFKKRIIAKQRAEGIAPIELLDTQGQKNPFRMKSNEEIARVIENKSGSNE